MKNNLTLPKRIRKFADRSISARKNLKSIDYNLLLKVSNDTSTKRYWHWVVWNAEAKRFFDPLEKGPKKKLSVEVEGYYTATLLL